MEPWQKDHITSNLPELIEKTTFNAHIRSTLLKEGIVSKVDLEQVNARYKQDGESTALEFLYNILTTRKNGYKVIGKAAFEKRQSGAFIILLRGLVEYLLQQNDLSLSETALCTILDNHWNKKHTLSFFLTKMDKPTLTEEDWLPSARNGAYISRHITNRIMVDPVVFKQSCTDMFVFAGVSRAQLSTLVEPNETTLSENVLLKNNTTARFLILDHESHWDMLTDMASEQAGGNVKSTRAMHLLQYDADSKEYILVRSMGSNEIISTFVPPHMRNKSYYYSEEEFLPQVGNAGDTNSICICDSPGMGKTWLLENMARKMNELHPKQIVAFISLAEFTQKHNLSNDEFSRKDSSAVNLLLRYLCKGNIMQAILNELLQKRKIKLELFLDGFDEVSQEHLENAKQFFGNTAKSDHNVRLFVTSRPHMRKDLERTFQAIAYDILPFSEENQVDFLVQFWKAATKQKLDDKKLKIFATACLQRLKKEVDLMGIPLQCFLLATVNIRNAQLYCCQVGTRTANEFISITSMDDMYRLYLEMGLNKALGQTDLTEGREETVEITEERRKLKAFHVWKSLELLFPRLAKRYFQHEKMKDRNPSARIYACGLLQAPALIDTHFMTSTFIHRTFAEYLVAELFAEVLTGRQLLKDKKLHREIVRLFFHDLSQVWERGHDKIIANFVNARLGSFAFDSIPKDIAKLCVKIIKKEGPSFLKAAIIHHHSYIVRLIKVILRYASQTKLVALDFLNGKSIEHGRKKTRNKYYDSCFYYIHHAAEYSNLAVVKELYSLYEECFGENLIDIFAKQPKDSEVLLRIALRKRDYSLVEHFAWCISIPQRKLLYDCFSYTRTCGEDKLKAAKDIYEILQEKLGDSIIKEPIILFIEDAHVELIKLLISQKADTWEANTEGKNMLAFHARFMYKEQFCELCHFLIVDMQAFHLFTHQLDRWNDPLPEIVANVGAATLKLILSVPGINLNVQDKNGNNLILRSIPGRDLNVIKFLEVNGVELHQKNIIGRSALHIAVQNDCIELVEYFLSKGLSLEAEDNEGNTPWLRSCWHIDTVKYLASHNANIHAVNKAKDNIAHLAASNFYVQVLGYLAVRVDADLLFTKKNAKGLTPISILHNDRFFVYNTSGVSLTNVDFNNPTRNDLRSLLYVIARMVGQREEDMQHLLEQAE